MKCTTAIAWQDLVYEVTEYSLDNFAQSKTILQQLNGTFQLGTLSGLMGPSGAGKTSLLNCIAGKKSSALSAGSAIYLNSNLSTVSYFIEQHVHETMFDSMTVRQIFEYAFAFKNGTSAEVASLRKQQIDLVMKQLMLPPDLLDRPFGNCSGGEMKRIAIAQELMALEKPNFLFVDEPTTGLDSCAAFEVMSCLKQLTTSPDYQMTVIASIHVPGNDILELFDKLYVLAKGGFCIYSGRPAAIESHLKQVIQRQLDDDQQPIEELIKIACDFQTPTVLQLAAHVQRAEMQTLNHQKSGLKRQPTGLSSRRKLFQITDLAIQLQRLFTLTFITEWQLVVKQLFTLVLVMCIFISIFNLEMVKPRGCAPLERLNQSLSCFGDLDSTALLNENIIFLNLSVDIFWYIIMATACVTLMPMVKVFSSEHRNRWYSLGTFFLSFNVIQILQLIFFAFIISLVIYFTSNLYTIDADGLNWTRMGHFFFSLVLYSIFTQSIGQALGVIFLDSILSGLICSIIVHTIITMISDLFITTDEVQSAAFIWFSDLIGVKHLFPYLVWTFYGIDRCSEEEFSYVLLSRNSANPDQIIERFIRTIGLNIIIIRVATFALLYCQFNSPFDLLWRLLKKLKLAVFKSSPHVNYNFSLSLNEDELRKADNNNDVKVKLEDVQPLAVVAKQEHLFAGKVSLAWRNLSLYGSSTIYESNSKATSSNCLEILRNINGQFTFGTLQALMGPSGAGKTSLLRVLNGQFKDRLSADSCFYLSKYQPIRTCFITQEVSDHLWPGVTAKQALVYASRLKNAAIADGQIDHEKIALKMLEQLDLLKTADTKLEKCSGGERKRLALAQELTAIQMPNLICIDEPTSGLDSNSSEIVISCLKRLAQSHQITIITSIHQPNSHLMQLFDQLYILARGGVCIYQGPPRAIRQHLAAIAHHHANSVKHSHETLIKYSCLGHQHDTVQALSQLNNEQFQNSTPLEDCQLVADGIKRTSMRFSFKALAILTSRYVAYVRDSQLLEWVFFLIYLFLFAKALLFFWQKHKNHDRLLDPVCINVAEEDTSNGGTGAVCSAASIERLADFKILQLSCAFNFFLHIIVNFLFSFKAGAHFFDEFPRLTNEHRNGWYSAGSCYLMKCLFEIVIAIPLLMFYLYIGDVFEPIRPGMYWYILAIMLLSMIAWQGMSHVIVLLFTENLLVQYMLQISINVTFAFFGNFILPLPHLHYIYQFFANFSIHRFTYEAIALLQYGFGQCNPRTEIQPILYYMGIRDDGHFVYCILMLVFNLVLYRTIAVWLLVAKLNPAHNRRERVLKIREHQSSLKPTKALSHGLSSSSANNVQFCV